MNTNPPQIIIKIIDQIRRGELSNHESLVLNAIDQSESNIDHLFKLAILCAQNNNLVEAELILKCLSLKASDDIKIPYNLGLVRSLRGSLHEAIDAYDLALQINPYDVETLINKSSAYNDLKKYEQALNIANDAININPKIPEAWANRGTALSHLDLFEDAVTAYQEACRLNPNFFEAWLNQNLPLNKLGRHDEALVVCDEAIRLQVNSDKANSNKAITLNELRQYDQALIYFDKAITLNPNLAENYFGKGVALYKLNKPVEALNQHNKAIILNADYAEAYHHKGLALNELKRFSEAIAEFNNAIRINPHQYEYWFSKGVANKELSQAVEARSCFKHALELNPHFYEALWANAFTYIPHILNGDENLESLRNQFISELEKFKELIPSKEMDNLYKVVGLYQPFYLPYQDLNNRGLLCQYGLVCDQLMHRWQLENQIKPTVKKEFGKIKIGIVSSHIYDHSVWHAITKGFLINFDSNQFEVHVFYLGTVFDDETSLAKSKSTSFSSQASSLLSWAELICDRDIEVLIYPEIGMDRLTAQLANLRLCSVQVAAWGHPETTGLPNIDYYLSADLFEPDSSDVYSEKLIRLPHLGSCYYRLPITPVERKIDGLPSGIETPILLCPGTPFKYNPINDWILLEIVKRLGKCKLVFFNRHAELSKILKARLEEKFIAANLSIDDHLVFIPWLESGEFYHLMNKSSVFLDTIGFSGFNTAIQAIDCALPIVTKEGQFMRGRLAAGLLKRMGLSQLVATSDHEYIELAVQLVKDKEYRSEITKKMTEMRSLLYEDTSVITALEGFLIGKLRES
jgi:predicted O-linked N-acetylglucosamine transferase (SPINDLY family)